MAKIGEKLPFPTWSYSKLSLYEQCPAKYKFRYVDKLSTPKGAAASRGTMIHEGVEAFLLGKAETIPREAADFWDIIKEVKKHKPKIEHKIGFCQNWKAVAWEDAWGRSVIDAGYKVGKEAIVPEWKSGKIYEDHADQRRLYATLAYLVWPDIKKSTAKTYYFDQKTIKSCEVLPEHVEEITTGFSQRVYFMHTDDEYAPRPTWSCAYCDYSRLKGGPCKKG